MVLQKLRSVRNSVRKTVDPDDYVVALDIGTEFVKALIAKIEDDQLKIIGVGRAR